MRVAQARVSSVPSSEQVLHELAALVLAEGLEQNGRRVELSAAPARPLVEQLRSRDAEEEDRGVAREVGDVLDEVDEDRLGPLQVVDHDHLRALCGAASSSRRNASCVSAGDVPMIESGSMPIAIRISTSGQYVIPSPYERQRPRRTSAESPTRSRKSATRRDLPMPAGPRSVKS